MVLSTFNQELYEKNLKQDAYEDGIEVGKEIGKEIGKEAALFQSVQNVMKNLKVPEEKACEIVGISLEEYEKAKMAK